MAALPYQRLAYSPQADLLALAFGPHLHVCDLSTGTIVATTEITEENAAHLSSPTHVLECPKIKQRVPLPAQPAAQAEATIAPPANESAPAAEHPPPATATRVATSVPPKPSAAATKVIPGDATVDEQVVRPELTGADIRSVVFSPDGRYLAVNRDDKALYLWDATAWQLRAGFCTLRRCNSLAFTRDSTCLLAADKFGDVYRYRLADLVDAAPADGGPIHDTLDDELIMGHVSMILDMAVTPGDGYVVTGDRDEKIRISQYPNCYTIQAFALAHTAFVSALAVPGWAAGPPLLLSGGGDGRFIVWDYVRGLATQIWELSKLFTELAGLTPKRVNVRRIRLSRTDQLAAVICEALPYVALFDLVTPDSGEFVARFRQLLPTVRPPLDLIFDRSDRLWVTGESSTSEPKPALVEAFAVGADGQYGAVSPGEAQAFTGVFAIHTRTVAKLPCVQSLEEYRKDPTRDAHES
ncbi:hypothetical protein IWQ60_002980 [Tieghemiomyces parasiticus]|uniref:Transfer RNA methyltransferase 82 n=1 Tax=Tieghemiomyces parasiticus TaxID=78921 RepID=A0A9W8AAF1_9FUNG|nr:hypothetical protein IWQ60_002980 [Tieghemiomyces parasiticus]